MRLAVLQPAAGGETLAKRLERLDATLSEAGTDLLISPELYLTGYDIGPALCERAEPMDGPMVGAVSAIAKRHDCFLLMGMPERDGPQVFNTAALLRPDGHDVARAGASETVLRTLISPEAVAEAQARLPYLTIKQAFD